MEFKKTFSALMDDLQPSPGSSLTAVRPPSPSRSSRLSSRRSSSSSRTNSLSQMIEPSQPISCVTRETFQEDCARHRFIVWAAVKRNSCTRMTAEERLECPLLRCTQRFLDHEMMLRHLAGCEFLSLGEYWCYDHMRVERFDDVKCKRCLGHPSKRRKMLSMAKTFFHSLGNKSKKGTGFEPDARDSVLAPPPSYDSLDLNAQLDPPTELSATEIVEIDSTEITTPAPLVPAFDGAIDPQALLVPELDSMAPSPEPFMQWQPMEGAAGPALPITPPEESEVSSPAERPSLQINTHGLPGGRKISRPAPRLVATVPRSKILSPSSSVRSNASTASNVSTLSNVSSLASQFSGAWSIASGFNTNLTSPDELVNPEVFWPNNPFTTSCDPNEAALPELPHAFCSELPADVPSAHVSEHVSPDPMAFFFSGISPANPSYEANIEQTGDPMDLIDLDGTATEESNVCCSGTKSLVASAWDALQEHIVSSMLKIRETRGNPLADQLRLKSTNSIATAGLRTLRAFLDGNSSAPAIDILCFIHLIYAFSLAVHGQDASDRARDLFLQSLSYAARLPPGERDLYTQLTFGIWQPSDITQEQISSFFSRDQRGSLSRSSSLKGKGLETSGHSGTAESDTLLTVAYNFLDELESLIIMGETPSSLAVQTSDLYAKHLLSSSPDVGVNIAFSVTVGLVLSMLHREFGNAEGLSPKFSGLQQRVGNGGVSSVRRFEIELLNAGKGCMSQARFYNSFVPEVRKLCDQIYEQHDAGTSRRTDYQRLGISLIESLLPQFDVSKGQAPIPDEAIDLNEFLNELSSSFGQDQAESYASIDTIAVAPFDMVTPSNLDAIATSGLQIPAITTTPPEASPTAPSIAENGPSPPQMENIIQQQQQQQQQEQTPDQSQAQTPAQTQAQKVEADSCCDICGYRPKGHPQWFKGSMAKHKRLQHSTDPPKLYKCPHPNCTSQYKNRPDNLRQHQIEKGHFVGDEAPPRRPSKRKRTEHDDERCRSD